VAESPTSRTLKLLRERGYRAAVVEKWNPHAKIRNDLFGFIDVLAIKDGETLAVQSTSDANVSARIHKIEDSDALFDVRKAGWSIHVHGWRKRKGRWQCREVNVS
jgi:hypothetical protein